MRRGKQTRARTHGLVIECTGRLDCGRLHQRLRACRRARNPDATRRIGVASGHLALPRIRIKRKHRPLQHAPRSQYGGYYGSHLDAVQFRMSVGKVHRPVDNLVCEPQRNEQDSMEVNVAMIPPVPETCKRRIPPALIFSAAVEVFIAHARAPLAAPARRRRLMVCAARSARSCVSRAKRSLAQSVSRSAAAALVAEISSLAL